MRFTYKQLIAIIYTVVLFLDRLDATIVNVTFPTVAKYFGVSLVATAWINLAFLLALAISIPISAWLAEHVGYKKIYIIAMLLFGFGSTLCIFSTSLNQLVFLRFVQGIGGGMLIPVGMTMIYRAYDPSEYMSITSFTFIPSLIAPAIGPFLGGLLLTFVSWQWVFACGGPICLLLALISIVKLKEEPRENQYPLDVLGFILSSTILISVFYGFSKLGSPHFSYDKIAPFAILPLLVWFFIKVEHRHSHPLIDLKFFKHQTFVRINLMQLCFQFCHFGAIFLVGLFLQAGVGFSAIAAGLMVGMQAVGSMTISRLSVYLFNRYSPKLPIIIGLFGLTILSPMIMLIHKPSLFMFGLILFLIRGIFSGLCGPPIQTLSVLSFDKKEMGTVTTLFNACRQVSISFGIAISSIFMTAGLHIAGVSGAIIPHEKIFTVFSAGFWAMTIMSLLGILITYQLSAGEMSA